MEYISKTVPPLLTHLAIVKGRCRRNVRGASRFLNPAVLRPVQSRHKAHGYKIIAEDMSQSVRDGRRHTSWRNTEGDITRDFVGAFTKELKATISLVISIRLSVRMGQTRLPTGRNFMEYFSKNLSTNLRFN